MSFSRAWRSDEMNGFGAIDELQLGERHDAALVERGLEGEVEPGERLDGGKTRHLEGHPDTAVLAQREFLREQNVERVESGCLAALDAAQGDIEDFEGARHFQSDEIAFDAVDNGRRRGVHRGPPCMAKRRPTAS
jgi:hypothetical protein